MVDEDVVCERFAAGSPNLDVMRAGTDRQLLAHTIEFIHESRKLAIDEDLGVSRRDLQMQTTDALGPLDKVLDDADCPVGDEIDNSNLCEPQLFLNTGRPPRRRMIADGTR
jgi:hypothetical protein